MEGWHEPLWPLSHNPKPKPSKECVFDQFCGHLEAASWAFPVGEALPLQVKSTWLEALTCSKGKGQLERRDPGARGARTQAAPLCGPEVAAPGRGHQL